MGIMVFFAAIAIEINGKPNETETENSHTGNIRRDRAAK